MPSHMAEYAYPSGLPSKPLHPRIAHLNQYINETATRMAYKALRPDQLGAASASMADMRASAASICAPLVQMLTGQSSPAMLNMLASPPHQRFQPHATPLLALGAALPPLAAPVAQPLALTDALQMPPPDPAPFALPPRILFAPAPADELAVAEDAMRAAAALRKAPARRKPAAATPAPDDDSDNKGDISLDGEGDDDEEAPSEKTATKCAKLKKKPAAAFAMAPTRGAHTSRAYDATVRDLKRKGYSDDDVKTKGRAAYQRAAR